MNPLENVRTAQRTAFHLSLAAARLPVTIAERVLRPADPEAWEPAVVFDTFASKAGRMVGGALGDTRLVEEADLTAERVRRLRRAAELEAAAEERREAADGEFQHRIRRDVERVQRVAETAEEQQETLAERAAAAEQAAEQRSQRRKASVRRATGAADEAITSQARDDRLRVLDAEESAVRKRRAAAAAEDIATADDAAIQRSRSARRSPGKS